MLLPHSHQTPRLPNLSVRPHARSGTSSTSSRSPAPQASGSRPTPEHRRSRSTVFTDSSGMPTMSVTLRRFASSREIEKNANTLSNTPRGKTCRALVMRSSDFSAENSITRQSMICHPCHIGHVNKRRTNLIGLIYGIMHPKRRFNTSSNSWH